MIEHYMQAFNIPISSKKFPLLLTYYKKSMEYEANFQIMHSAFMNQDTDKWRFHNAIEDVLQNECKKLRTKLRIPSNSQETNTPNKTCIECNVQYYRKINNQESGKFCPKCLAAHKEQKRINNRLLINSVDLNKDLRTIEL